MQKKGEIAKIVLLPGDPLRAKSLANKFLKNVKLVSSVRNVLFFTGEYKGNLITIAGSGMGAPSIGIYSYELFKFYDVDYIIRIGSAGSYVAELELFDLFNVKDVYTDSTFPLIAANINSKIIDSNEELFNLINQTAKDNNISLKTGRAHTSDVFYCYDSNYWKIIRDKYNAKCIEMEAAALFSNALNNK